MLDYDPKHCPLCGCEHMSYGEPFITYQAQTIELPITCSKCHSKWTEVFTFNHAKMGIEE